MLNAGSSFATTAENQDTLLRCVSNAQDIQLDLDFRFMSAEHAQPQVVTMLVNSNINQIPNLQATTRKTRKRLNLKTIKPARTPNGVICTVRAMPHLQCVESQQHLKLVQKNASDFPKGHPVKSLQMQERIRRRNALKQPTLGILVLYSSAKEPLKPEVKTEPEMILSNSDSSSSISNFEAAQLVEPANFEIVSSREENVAIHCEPLVLEDQCLKIQEAKAETNESMTAQLEEPVHFEVVSSHEENVVINCETLVIEEPYLKIQETRVEMEMTRELENEVCAPVAIEHANSDHSRDKKIRRPKVPKPLKKMWSSMKRMKSYVKRACSKAKVSPIPDTSAATNTKPVLTRSNPQVIQDELETPSTDTPITFDEPRNTSQVIEFETVEELSRMAVPQLVDDTADNLEGRGTN